MSDYIEIDFLGVETKKSGDAIAMRYEINGSTYIHVVDGGYRRQTLRAGKESTSSWRSWARSWVPQMQLQTICKWWHVFSWPSRPPALL